MRCKKGSFSHEFVRQALLLLPFALFFTGCAYKPWTAPLQTKQAEATAQLIDSLAARDVACGKTLEGDLALFLETPLGNMALSGFLQFSLPSSYKFVVTNPLGQPLLAVAGNQEWFQAINAPRKKYMEGSINSFGVRNKIPELFLAGSWGEWITGRNFLGSQAITHIRHDRSTRGIWVTFQNKNSNQTVTEHLLLAPEEELIIARILENREGKKVAQIDYANWMPQRSCRQPLDINITGLEYGSNIRITLSDVLLFDEVSSYRLPTPSGTSGYIKQFMP